MIEQGSFLAQASPRLAVGGERSFKLSLMFCISQIAGAKNKTEKGRKYILRFKKNAVFFYKLEYVIFARSGPYQSRSS